MKLGNEICRNCKNIIEILDKIITTRIIKVKCPKCKRINQFTFSLHFWGLE